LWSGWQVGRKAIWRSNAEVNAIPIRIVSRQTGGADSAAKVRRAGGTPLFSEPPRGRNRRQAESLREPVGGDRRRAATAVALDASPVWEVMPGEGGAAWSPGAEITARRDAIFRRSLAASDVVATYLALFAVIWLLPGNLDPRASLVLLAPAVVVLSKAIGLYDRDQHRLRKATIDEIPSLLNLAVFSSLVVWLGQAVLLNGALDRAQVLALLAASFGLLTAGRLVTRIAALRFTPPERCLVIGSSSECGRAVTALKFGQTSGTKAVVVGQIGWAADEDIMPSDRPGFHEVIAREITASAVERVILAPDGCEQDQVLDLIRLIKALGVKLSVLPRLLEVVGSASVFDELDGLSLLGVRPYGLSKSSELLKRTMDFAGAFVLLLGLAPLLILISILIKLDSTGPVFFVQRRTGRHGQQFGIIKFRSMVADAEQIKDRLRGQNEVAGGLFKISADPRITRVGGLLRKTSIDELPQLLNVLRGEMSLVGPRPLVPDEDALVEGWQRRRLAVKPGMTGLWQIFGSSRVPLPDMVKLDYMYGANWSLWLDMKILLRTLPYVVSRRGI